MGFDSENRDSVIIDTTGCFLTVLYFCPIIGYMILYWRMPALVQKVDPDNYKFFKYKIKLQIIVLQIFMIPRLIIYIISKFEYHILQERKGKSNGLDMSNILTGLYYLTEIFGIFYIIYMHFKNL